MSSDTIVWGVMGVQSPYSSSFFFFFHCLYIPEWDLTHCLNFRDSNVFYEVGSSAAPPTPNLD
jgi:hypothetical protein